MGRTQAGKVFGGFGGFWRVWRVLKGVEGLEGFGGFGGFGGLEGFGGFGGFWRVLEGVSPGVQGFDTLPDGFGGKHACPQDIVWLVAKPGWLMIRGYISGGHFIRGF